MNRDPAFGLEFLVEFQDQLMFGTDRCVREENPQIIEILPDMALPADVEEAVVRGNAEGMLGLTMN